MNFTLKNILIFILYVAGRFGAHLSGAKGAAFKEGNG